MRVSFSFPVASAGNPLFPSTRDQKDDLAPGLNLEGRSKAKHLAGGEF